MTGYLIDTDWVADYLKGKNQAVKTLATLPTLRLSTSGLYDARERRIVCPSQKVVG